MGGLKSVEAPHILRLAALIFVVRSRSDNIVNKKFFIWFQFPCDQRAYMRFQRLESNLNFEENKLADRGAFGDSVGSECTVALH